LKWGCKYIRELTRGVADAKAYNSAFNINGIRPTYILIFSKGLPFETLL